MAGKKTNVSSALAELKEAKDVISFLEQPTIAIAEALTGILASGLSEYRLSTGRIVQSVIKRNLFTQLGREIKQYQEKGKIKENYFATNKQQATLLELLKFIDNDTPDEEIFKAMKAIYFCGIATDADEKEEEVAYQFLLLCKKLTSMDVLILKTCHKIYTGEITGVNTAINSHGDWVGVVSDKIGYDLPELVSAADDKLVELGLLSGRGYSDKSGIRPGRDFRLTKLSIKLMDYIAKWE